MKVYEGTDIRNVGLVGHGHSGKTSLTAAILYATGATNRLTRVDEGNTITDFDDEEVQRKMTISTGVAYAEWQSKVKVNLLDTPGFNIFMNDTRAALVAADAALVMVDGVAGVEVVTEKTWKFCDEERLPRAFVINKLDRERADFERSLGSMQETFGRTAIPVQLPIGSERDFKGVIDLVRMKAYTYETDGDGKGTEGDIPGGLADAAQKAHEALVEMVAEGNDALMEEFFDKGTLPVEHMVDGLRQAVRERRIYPVLCASALHNIGTDLILDFVARIISRRRRSEVPPKARWTANVTDRDDRPTPSLLSAFVFKTVADPFAGRVSYFKVISGVVKNDANLNNMRTGVAERLLAYRRSDGQVHNAGD